MSRPFRLRSKGATTTLPFCRRTSRAAYPLFQHLLDTYASETDKTISTWRGFAPEALRFRPHSEVSLRADRRLELGTS